jgi:hypothetical protein
MLRRGCLVAGVTEVQPEAKAIQEQQKTIDQLAARRSTFERDRAPRTASVLPGGGGLVAIGLLPVGLIVAARRRKQRGG